MGSDYQNYKKAVKAAIKRGGDVGQGATITPVKKGGGGGGSSSKSTPKPTSFAARNQVHYYYDPSSGKTTYHVGSPSGRDLKGYVEYKTKTISTGKTHYKTEAEVQAQASQIEKQQMSRIATERADEAKRQEQIKARQNAEKQVMAARQRQQQRNRTVATNMSNPYDRINQSKSKVVKQQLKDQAREISQSKVTKKYDPQSGMTRYSTKQTMAQVNKADNVKKLNPKRVSYDKPKPTQPKQTAKPKYATDIIQKNPYYKKFSSKVKAADKYVSESKAGKFYAKNVKETGRIVNWAITTPMKIPAYVEKQYKVAERAEKFVASLPDTSIRSKRGMAMTRAYVPKNVTSKGNITKLPKYEGLPEYMVGVRKPTQAEKGRFVGGLIKTSFTYPSEHPYQTLALVGTPAAVGTAEKFIAPVIGTKTFRAGEYLAGAGYVGSKGVELAISKTPYEMGSILAEVGVETAALGSGLKYRPKTNKYAGFGTKAYQKGKFKIKEGNIEVLKELDPKLAETKAEKLLASKYKASQYEDTLGLRSYKFAKRKVQQGHLNVVKEFDYPLALRKATELAKNQRDVSVLVRSPTLERSHISITREGNLGFEKTTIRNEPLIKQEYSVPTPENEFYIAEITGKNEAFVGFQSGKNTKLPSVKSTIGAGAKGKHYRVVHKDDLGKFYTEFYQESKLGSIGKAKKTSEKLSANVEFYPIDIPKTSKVGDSYFFNIKGKKFVTDGKNVAGLPKEAVSFQIEKGQTKMFIDLGYKTKSMKMANILTHEGHRVEVFRKTEAIKHKSSDKGVHDLGSLQKGSVRLLHKGFKIEVSKIPAHKLKKAQSKTPPLKFGEPKTFLDNIKGKNMKKVKTFTITATPFVGKFSTSTRRKPDYTYSQNKGQKLKSILLTKKKTKTKTAPLLNIKEKKQKVLKKKKAYQNQQTVYVFRRNKNVQYSSSTQYFNPQALGSKSSAYMYGRSSLNSLQKENKKKVKNNQLSLFTPIKKSKSSVKQDHFLKNVNAHKSSFEFKQTKGLKMGLLQNLGQRSKQESKQDNKMALRVDQSLSMDSLQRNKQKMDLRQDMKLKLDLKLDSKLKLRLDRRPKRTPRKIVPERIPRIPKVPSFDLNLKSKGFKLKTPKKKKLKAFTKYTPTLYATVGKIKAKKGKVRTKGLSGLSLRPIIS